MKKTVYTKAGQVGLVEVERPRIEAPDDVILRIVRTCVCGSDLWSYRNPDIEAGHQDACPFPDFHGLRPSARTAPTSPCRGQCLGRTVSAPLHSPQD